MKEKCYVCCDLKSFYASVECVERGLDPMTTNLVVADKRRTDKTICLAQNGPLYRLEHKDLQGLPEIHCAGGHLPLQHRRGVHGRDQLPGHLPHDGPGADPHDHPGHSQDHRHHRRGGHGHQPVPGQGGHGHRGQARAGGRVRGAHRGAGRGELPAAAVGPPPPHRLLAGG